MSEITAELLAQANAEIYLKWASEARLYCTKILYQEGQSASQIANKIGGVSRNAVIGIIHRKGWVVDRRQTRLRSPRKPKATRVPKAQPKQPPSAKVFMFGKNMPNFGGEPYMPPIEELVIPPKERKYITTLTEICCRWPIGDPLESEFHFCGKSKVDGLPYCEFHARRAYQPPQQRRRDNVSSHLPPIVAGASIPSTQSAAGRQNTSGGREGSQGKNVGAGELVEAK